MSGSEILPLGSFLPVDAEGFIAFPTDPLKIQAEWRTIVDAMVARYRDHFGANLHSVYVRGSVAKGEAIAGVSDLDTLAIIREGANEVQPAWAGLAEIRAAFPICTGVECLVYSLPSLESVRPGKTLNAVKRLIKTQSLCVWGENLAESIPPVKPGPEMISHLFDLHEDLPSAEELASITLSRCTWLMKRIVRSGFELVMEGKFTRDLYPCYSEFAARYPEKEAEMRRALELAIFPSVDRALVEPVANGIGAWVAARGLEARGKL